MNMPDVFLSKRELEAILGLKLARSVWVMVQGSDVYWETKLEITKTKQGQRREYNRAFHVGEVIDFLEEQADTIFKARQPLWKTNLNEIRAKLEGELEL